MIKQASFFISSSKLEQCPPADRPEFAFIGRSNVGKSSLINLLTGRKALAKTSSTPGKTQLINHFIIDDKWYLVDLPGYGFAKVSKKDRSTFKGMIFSYLKNRENLDCVFVLIDSRHEPQKVDTEFMAWLGENGIPFVMVFTKIDKLSKTELPKNIARYNKIMRAQWEELPPQFFTSSTNKDGKVELEEFIAEVLEQVG